tara:strand:- start:352 stop:1323 length:972 start_codon:yes stop_codon:yes gene_type:complete
MTELKTSHVRGYANVVYLNPPEDQTRYGPSVPMATLLERLIPKHPNWTFVLCDSGRVVLDLEGVNQAVCKDVALWNRGKYLMSGLSILSEHNEFLGYVKWDMDGNYVMRNNRISNHVKRGEPVKTTTDPMRAARIVDEFFKPISPKEAVFDAANLWFSERHVNEPNVLPETNVSQQWDFWRTKDRDPVVLGERALEMVVAYALRGRGEHQRGRINEMVFAVPYQGKIALGFINEVKLIKKALVRPVVGDTYVLDRSQMPEELALRLARVMQLGERTKKFGRPDSLTWIADYGAKLDDLGFTLLCPDPDETRQELSAHRHTGNY